jgi:hypothetical protein
VPVYVVINFPIERELLENNYLHMNTQYFDLYFLQIFFVDIFNSLDNHQYHQLNIKFRLFIFIVFAFYAANHTHFVCGKR